MANNKYTYEIKVEGLNGVKTLDDLLKATSSTIGGLEQRKRVLEDLVKNVDRSSKEFKDFSRELNQTNLELKKFDSQIEGVGLVEFAENATKVAGAITGAFALGTIAVDTFGESLGISKEELEKAEASFQKLLLAVQSFQALSEGFKAFNTLLPTIQTGVNSIRTAFVGLNTVTKASIFGLGLAAIALVVTYWEDITNYISNSNAELEDYNENESKRLDNTKQRVDLTLKSYERIQEAELKLSQNQLNRNENIDEEIALLKDKFNITKNTFNEEIKKAKELKKDLEIEKSLKNEISKIDQFIKDATEQRNFLLRNGVLTKESEASLNKKIEEAEKRRLGFVADLNKASDLELEKNRILLSIQNQIDEKEGKKLEKIREEKDLRDSILNNLQQQKELLDSINDSKDEEKLKKLQNELVALEIRRGQEEKLNLGTTLKNLGLIRDKQLEIEEQTKKISLDNNEEEKKRLIQNAKDLRDLTLNNEKSTLEERKAANIQYANTIKSINQSNALKLENIEQTTNNNKRKINEAYLEGVAELSEKIKKIGEDAATEIKVTVTPVVKPPTPAPVPVPTPVVPIDTADEAQKKLDIIKGYYNEVNSIVNNLNGAINLIGDLAIDNLRNKISGIDSIIKINEDKLNLLNEELSSLEEQRNALQSDYNEALINNNLTALEAIREENDAVTKSISEQRKEKARLEKENIKQAEAKLKKEEEVAKKQQILAKTNIAIAFAQTAAQTALSVAQIAVTSSRNDFTFGIATVASIATVLASIVGAVATAKQLGSFAEGGFTDKNKLGSRDETGYRVAGIVHEGEYVIPKKVLDSGLFDNEINRLEAARKGSFVQGGFTSNNVTVINNNDEVISLLSVIASKDNVVKITDINDTQNKLNSIEVSARS